MKLLAAIQDLICDFSPSFLDRLLDNHFSKAADELWDWTCAERARQRLVETEAEEEVAEPTLCGYRVVIDDRVPKGGPWPFYPESSSPVCEASAGHAGDECQEPPPVLGVEAPGTQLTQHEIKTAAFAVRNCAYRSSGRFKEELLELGYKLEAAGGFE